MRRLQARQAWIDATGWPPVYPSDHFPVVADLSLTRGG